MVSSFTTSPIFVPTTAERMSHCATTLVLPDGERLAAWMTGTYETAPDQYIALARRPAGSSDCYRSTGTFTNVNTIDSLGQSTTDPSGGVINAVVPLSRTLIYIKNPTSGTPTQASVASPVFNTTTNLTVPAASSTDTTDTTKPISHPCESCEVMIAAITTPMPTMPPVATNRMSGASSGSRLRPLGIITPGRSAGAPRRSLRAARRASRSASGCPSPLPGVVADMKPEYPARAGLWVRHDGRSRP